jgi:hypothetical protein
MIVKEAKPDTYFTAIEILDDDGGHFQFEDMGNHDDYSQACLAFEDMLVGVRSQAGIGYHDHNNW